MTWQNFRRYKTCSVSSEICKNLRKYQGANRITNFRQDFDEASQQGPGHPNRTAGNFTGPIISSRKRNNLEKNHFNRPILGDYCQRCAPALYWEEGVNERIKTEGKMSDTFGWNVIVLWQKIRARKVLLIFKFQTATFTGRAAALRFVLLPAQWYINVYENFLYWGLLSVITTTTLYCWRQHQL